MGATLLLADDSITIQKVVELTFAETDHSVVAVGNGRDLLARVSEVEPDLILCDVVMPDMNGYEICQQLKSESGTLHIPVVLLTGTFEPFDRDRALAAGCDAIITKPFEARELVATVDDLLQRKERSEVASADEALDEGIGVPEGVQGIDFTTTGFDQMVPPPPPPEVAPEDGLEITGSAFVSGVSPAPPPAPPELAAEEPWGASDQEEEGGTRLHEEGVEDRVEFAPATEGEPGGEVTAEVETEDEAFAEVRPEEADADVEVEAEEAAQIGAEEEDAEPDAADESAGTEVEQSKYQEPPAPASPDAARALAHLEEVERRAQGERVFSPPPPAEDFAFATDVPADLGPSAGGPEALEASAFDEGPQPEPFPSDATSPPPSVFEETPAPAPAGSPGAVAVEPPTPPDAQPDAELAEEPRPHAAVLYPQPDAESPAPTPEPLPLEPEAVAADSQESPATPVAEPPTPVAEEQPPPAAIVEAPPEVEPPAPVAEPAPVEPAAVAAVVSQTADPGPAAGAGSLPLTQDDVDRIARRVLELAEPLLSRIAWEVIPDMAEMLVRQRIRELEEAAEEEA